MNDCTGELCLVSDSLSPPTQITTTTVSETSIQVTWTSTLQSDVATVMIQYKKSDETDFATADEVSETQLTLNGLQANTTYNFRLRTQDGAMVSKFSEVVDGATFSQEASAIAAGPFNHGCVVIEGGVKCWGENEYGQLGNGTTTDSLALVNVSGITSGATAVAAGDGSSCAIINGGVKCWGYQYGNVPTSVAGLTSGVTAITSGHNTRCAIVNGAAKCWGVNGSGALGNGTTANSTNPVQVTGLTSGVTSISTSGGGHTCAVVNGGVKCWGDNGHGQLGNGTTTNATSPVQVTGITSGATAVSTSYVHSCAIVNGGIKCWGENQFAGLGNGTTISSYTPVNVSGVSSGATVLASSEVNTCAVISGAAKCWGNNGSGTLGNGTNNTSYIPVGVTGLTSGVTKLSGGESHFCAIASGSAKCWGNNSHGQLGDGTTNNSNVPVNVIH